MISKKSNLLGIALFIFLIAAILLIYSQNKRTSATSYITDTAKIGNIENKVVSFGTIAASQLITVGSQASGQIKKMYVQLGSNIKQGQLIADIDSTTQLNDLNSARAILKNYEAQHTSRLIAQNIAQTQNLREEKLRKNDSTSQENLENAKKTFESAKAQLAEIESLIVQARIAVDTAEANLAYTQITAPIDGVIVSLPVEEGQTINASQVTPTIALLAVLDVMSIKILISEADITRINSGMLIKFKILSDQRVEYTTHLHSIDPGNTLTTDSSTENSSSAKKITDSAIYYYGKALISNKDNRLRIGMTTQNNIIISSKNNIVLVPNSAINMDGEKQYVFVIDDNNKILKQFVVTGVTDNINTEIISGLTGGEKVITSEITEDEINKNIEKIE